MKKIIVILMGMTLMFGAMSCSNGISDNDLLGTVITSENTNSSNDGESVTPIPSKDEENNGKTTNTTSCDVTENEEILALHYFVCVDNSPTELEEKSIDKESIAKKESFFIRGYVSTHIEIRVKYENNKLNFSNDKNAYTIKNVVREGSNVNIFIEWTN